MWTIYMHTNYNTGMISQLQSRQGQNVDRMMWKKNANAKQYKSELQFV